jgi:hypothetical protein
MLPNKYTVGKGSSLSKIKMSPTKIEEGEKPTNKSANNASGTKPTLSLRDQEILMAAWLSIKGAEPQVCPCGHPLPVVIFVFINKY